MTPQEHVNEGNRHRLVGCLSAAIISYDNAIELKPDYANAYNNKGCVLQELERYKDAFNAYDKALHISPSIPYLLGNWWYCSMQIGYWQNIDDVMNQIKDDLVANRRVVAPFIALLMPLTPHQLRCCAEIYAKN